MAAYRTTDGATGAREPLLTPGQRVHEGLVVDRRLGEGAFAEVYRVRHHVLGWQALKLFKHGASLGANFSRLDEARILSTLGHPSIIRVFDAGTVDTAEGVRGYFTMEYVAGGSLERLVESHGGVVPVPRVTAVLRQAADGLSVAHERQPPVVHRDLSLANVLVAYEESGPLVKVSDFGLARETDPVTRAASAQGTVAYMPPEVLIRGRGYTCAGDVWALGTIVYYLLTNRFPYDADDPARSFSPDRFEHPLRPPGDFNDDADAELEWLVADMLRVDPGERPAMREVAERAAPRPAAPPPLSPAEAPAPPARPAPPVPPAEPAEPAPTAEELVRAALALSRVPGRLADAADRLEEALSRHPRLRERHLTRLTTWRRGVMQ
ncbi:serine/threonine-protein kinase [Streptomyces sp. WMMC500]|uniref:serine/threonine-protein kinase n=1 Tax=Streptomyces sp. WMMC500 TaxID=3015154 RepID=UPI00248ABC22|nr:serine/threonine-protein kinase [Streptomyces sp. WMMC500]WBB64070.1 serine/threonine-protein kinase [Streptomyces sp. WMMC500]